MKNIRFFLSENFMFLEVKFSVCLNRRVFVMRSAVERYSQLCSVLDTSRSRVERYLHPTIVHYKQLAVLLSATDYSL